MAYMKKIYDRCHHSGCKKRATHSVFDYRNASYGDFCLPHAKELVAKLKIREKAGTLGATG